MLELYLAFTAFVMTATLGSAFLCWKMSRMEMTSTLTWSVLCLAFVLRFATQLQAMFYLEDIVLFMENYPIPIVLLGQTTEALIMGLFFFGVLKTYTALWKLGLK